jgi:hypothetical protein
MHAAHTSTNLAVLIRPRLWAHLVRDAIAVGFRVLRRQRHHGRQGGGVTGRQAAAGEADVRGRLPLGSSVRQYAQQRQACRRAVNVLSFPSRLLALKCTRVLM